MKITRKMLCLAIAIIMVVTSMAQVVFAAEETSDAKVEFSDVAADAEYADAVYVLNLMGVINGYEDGSFKPDQDVTRAEFTAMLMRTLNMGGIGSPTAAGLPFTDVLDADSSISWAIPNINTAYGMKIINGYEDSTFRPNANVAFQEAVKMIVCTLGYGENIDVSVEPWYANYISTATQIGLLKNANMLGQPGTPASRACIAQMLYDALEIPIIENEERTEKTILSDYMRFTKNTGVISSNGITSLESPDANLRDDEIQISATEPDTRNYETHTYSTRDKSLKNYLGYGVEYYYKEAKAGIRELVFCVVKNNPVVEINAANIELNSTTDTAIKYYKDLDDQKPLVANLESDNVVVLNGKLYGSNAANSRFDSDVSDPETRMIPTVGKVVLVDSDNNKKFDVVFIEKVDVYYVDNKVSSTYEIIDNVLTGTQRKLKLDVDSDRNLEIVNEAGKEVSFSSISKGNVICYTKSNGSNTVSKAVVLTEKVQGTVSQIKGGKITISGKQYRYSPAAAWYNGGSLAEPELQLSATFYLDLNGDIIAYDKTQSSDKYNYGYILTYGIDNTDFEAVAVIEILTQSGTTTRISSYEKTKVDGHTCKTGEEVVDALLESGDEQYKKDGASNDRQRMQQLIKYTTKKVSGATVFDKIVTAEDQGSSEVEEDTLLYYDDMTPGESLTYNSSSKTLSADGVNLKVSSTIVFAVPEDRGDYDAFKKSTASGMLKKDKSYSVEAFDVKTSVPKVIVIHGVDNSQAIDTATPLYVLTDETSVAENKDVNKTMTQIEGAFKIGPKTATTAQAWLSNDSDALDLLAIGDVFRAGTDRDGFYDVDTILFDADGGNDVIITDETGEEIEISDIYTGECVNIVATVKAKDEDNVVITGDFGDITFGVEEFEEAKILVYIEEGKNMEVKEEADYVAAISSLTASEDTGNVSNEIFIYMVDGEIKLLYILPVEAE